MKKIISAPDLTKRPPRSPRVRLGGYAILPRMLDKGRARLAGKNGEFHYNCPLDHHFLKFAGVSAKALLKELAKGKGDWEILQWIQARSKTKPTNLEIAAWSAYHDQRGPTDLESREYFHDYHVKLAPHREDVAGWFDVLDIDDHVTFGGKA
ncbi:MAG: DUF5069 domain-containing protein [Verrucomicrobia bacterium]|nr:DUF5069 domain-containing protein [Verrucomicrobiota bacterium]